MGSEIVKCLKRKKKFIFYKCKQTRKEKINDAIQMHRRKNRNNMKKKYYVAI